MTDGRHIENRFLAIYRRYIGWFMQISEWRWRITCRYRTVDQNGNFRKFKMAGGRHFENSFISISQSELSDFDQIWYADANFHSQYGYLTKLDIFFKFKMADGRHIENRFLVISRRLIGRLTWNSEWRWGITCRCRSRDQKWKFPQI